MCDASPDHAHRHRASAIGSLAATALTGCGVAALHSTWNRVVATTTVAMPVEQALLTLVALGVGAALLALAWVCALGAIAAHHGGAVRVAESQHRLTTGRWATRTGAVLLSLTMSAPSAQATPADAGVLAPVAAAAGRSSDHAEDRRPADQDSDRREPARGVPLPGWGSPKSSDTGARARNEQAPPAGADTSATVHDPEVVITRGDTLWSVAAAHLGPGATNTLIADHWPRWYAENRDIIGSDPDLVRPGQILQPPQRRSAAADRGAGAGR